MKVFQGQDQEIMSTWTVVVSGTCYSASCHGFPKCLWQEHRGGYMNGSFRTAFWVTIWHILCLHVYSLVIYGQITQVGSIPIFSYFSPVQQEDHFMISEPLPIFLVLNHWTPFAICCMINLCTALWLHNRAKQEIVTSEYILLDCIQEHLCFSLFPFPWYWSSLCF